VFAIELVQARPSRPRAGRRPSVDPDRSEWSSPEVASEGWKASGEASVSRELLSFWPHHHSSQHCRIPHFRITGLGFEGLGWSAAPIAETPQLAWL
jgi:hypothetical protein